MPHYCYDRALDCVLVLFGIVALSIGLSAAQAQPVCPRTPSLTADNTTCANTDFVQNVTKLKVANNASGTTLNKLAKLTGAPSTAVTAGTSDTSGIVGIVTAGDGTSGTATVTLIGQASCIFDGATTAGDYIQNSPTVAGDCHDAGSSIPSSGQVIGQVLSTNASGGLYSVALFGANPPSTGGVTSLNSLTGALSIIAGGGISSVMAGGSSITVNGPPTAGGRLSIDTSSCSATPAYQPNNITAGGVVCYVPYLAGIGNVIWVNGLNLTFNSSLTATLDTNFTTGNPYDFYAYNCSGSACICWDTTQWTSTTARSHGITQNANGLWQNSGSISTCENNSSHISLTAGQGTYLGTCFATANGQTQWVPTPAIVIGGTNNVLGCYNAYNKVAVLAHVWDQVNNTNAQYTESTGTGTFDRFDGAAATGCSTPGVGVCNIIWYVDGLGTVGAGSTTVKVTTSTTWAPTANQQTGGANSGCLDYAGAHACTMNSIAGCAAQLNQEAFGTWASLAIDSGNTLVSFSFCSTFGQHSFTHLVSFPTGSGGPASLFGASASGMILEALL